MKSPLFALCLVGCGAVAYAAITIEYQTLKPGQTVLCVDKTGNKRKVGEEWHDQKKCIRMRCLADSQGTPLISSSYCSSFVQEGCRLVQPEGLKNYPDCCPKVECTPSSPPAN